MKDAIESDTVVRELLGERVRGAETDCVLPGRTAQFVQSLQATGLPDTVLDQFLAQNVMAQLVSLKELCRTLNIAIENETRAREKALHTGSIDSSFGLGPHNEIPFITAAT